jgi:hypothetical protein
VSIQEQLKKLGDRLDSPSFNLAFKKAMQAEKQAKEAEA